MHWFLRYLSVAFAPVSLIFGLWMIFSLWRLHIQTMVDRFKAAKLKPPEQKALRVKRAAVVRYLAVSGAIMVTILLIVWISLLFRRPVLIIIGWTLIITQILCRGYLKWVLESYSRKNIEYWKDLMKIERQKKPPATPGKRR